MILIEKQPRYWLHNQAKLINMNILLVKLYDHLINKINLLILLNKKKQIKTTEDQGQKQVDALEDLKLGEQTKPAEDKSNNQSKATIIFNDLINKRKK